jgi:hypothetical protein
MGLSFRETDILHPERFIKTTVGWVGTSKDRLG